MKKNLLLIFILAALSVNAQMNWVEMPSITHLHYSPASYMVGTKFYVCGGLVNSSVSNGDLDEYDITTNVWTRKSPLPAWAAMYGAKGFSVNGKLYLTCGQTNTGLTDSLYEYNPATDLWSTMASFPGGARYTACQFSIGNFGYVGLGFSPYYNDLYRYDATTNTWAQMTNFPGTARQSAFSFVVDGSAYIGLGSDGTNPSDVYRFDTAGTGTWTQVASFPGISRNSGASFGYGGNGYIMCGYDANATTIYNDIWKYSVAANSWTNLGRYPGEARREVAYANLDSILIIGAGDTTVNGSGLSGTYWKTCFNSECTTNSIPDLALNISLKCYPSPTSGSFAIDLSSFDAGQKEIAIYNDLGQIAYQTTTDQNKMQVTDELPSGLYTVSITQNTRRESVRIVVIK